MKPPFLILFIIIVFINMGHTYLSIPQKSNIINSPDSVSLFVRDTIQIGSLKIGYSTLDDAKKEFGLQGEIHKSEDKNAGYRKDNKCYSLTVFCSGTVDTVKGIYVYGEGRDLDVITNIIFTKRSKWKAKDGIGIGSTYSEIIKAWGLPTDDRRTVSNLQDITYGNGFFTITLSSYVTDLVFQGVDEKGRRVYNTDTSQPKCDTIKTINIDFHKSYEYDYLRKDGGPRYKNLKRKKCHKPCVKC